MTGHPSNWTETPANTSGLTGLNPQQAKSREFIIHYIRDSDLKDVVLNQLFPQHDDAELDAELHETASWGTL